MAWQNRWKGGEKNYGRAVYKPTRRRVGKLGIATNVCQSHQPFAAIYDYEAAL